MNFFGLIHSVKLIPSCALLCSVVYCCFCEERESAALSGDHNLVVVGRGTVVEQLTFSALPGRAPSKRGVALSFGPDVTEEFLKANHLGMEHRLLSYVRVTHTAAPAEPCLSLVC